MVRFLSLMLTAAVCLQAAGAPQIEKGEYRKRRDALRKDLGDAVVVLFGNTEREGGDLRSGFFQEQNFFYLSGWAEPGAVMVLTPERDVLLIPRRDAVQERWTGPKAAPGDKGVEQAVGFDQVEPTESLELNLPKWVAEGRNVYTLTGTEGAASLGKLLPLRELRNAGPAITKLRSVKSPAEIAMIQYATDAGVAAHKAAWKTIRPGASEFEVAAAMTSVYFTRGCERNAYAPIVGTGGNAAILHYSKNKRKMDSGELVLMDVGPECSMYATDITRTVPVNGKFTARQKELYDIVLGAQKAALAAVKPGVMFGSRTNNIGLHKIAVAYLNAHGKDKHGKPLGEYFIHSLGHHVGLDVHDPYDSSKPLQAGMVITLEPGLYIPEEGIGIRIEDMVLVTENGGVLMSGDLPRETAEIEKMMAR